MVPPSAAHGPWQAVAALLSNAGIWGLSWWPFRQLESQGLHPLWATALIYALAVAALSVWRGSAWGELLRTPSLWWLVVASGTTNAAFNWGITAGDVVRVVLLFYLMPLWAALLARALLGEALTRGTLLRVLLALLGAVIVLWPPGGGLPLPGSLAEALGVLGGFSFALNNVLLRREAKQPAAARALAMFTGGAAVAAVVASALALGGQVAWPPPPAPGWVLGAGLLGAAFLLSNAALQYGAARLPASVTAVVMVTEVVFAAGSAVLLGAGQLTPALLCGGALIVGATLLSARSTGT
jgi:drug/metabolite transporter (DMT)-like permease